MAEYKNTLQFIWHGCKQTIHFVNRPHDIECQVYAFGNPQKAITFAYFDKDLHVYHEVGKEYEWTMCKKVTKAILYHKFKVADDVARRLYNDTIITPLGKLEVFNDGIQ
jgi:hypothetical protein